MAGQDVDWDQVQGIVLSSYWDKPLTRYFLLTITDVQAARKWLHDELGIKPSTISFNDDRTDNGPSINIAFTMSGLKKLGLGQDTLDTFPWDFRDGMTSQLRRKILADRGHNDPHLWEWGEWGLPNNNGLLDRKGNDRSLDDERLHVLVMLYAPEVKPPAGHPPGQQWDRGPELRRLAGELEARWGNAFAEIGGNRSKVGYRPPKGPPFCEHFGFADGLSQPAIETSPRSRKFQERGDFDGIVRSGEFILGYVNERGQLPVSPTVAGQPGTGLPTITYVDRSVSGKVHQNVPRKPPRLDFGRNGTFLVYRQLEQDVFAFDDLIREASHALGYDTAHRLSDEADFRQMLAAKLIGRWDDGTPLTLEPRSPPKPGGNLRAVNNFGFADEDSYGLRCPIGAHIRRANPRDTLAPDPKHAMRRNNRHRLLRRGRLYGEPTGWTAWDDHGRGRDGKRPRDNVERGLHFFCINACIESQFEFVQQSWMNTSFFGGLSDEVDPLLGVSDGVARWFTIQGAPISRRIPLNQPLVTVKGGAYFFLPSREALNYLAKARASGAKADGSARPTLRGNS